MAESAVSESEKRSKVIMEAAATDYAAARNAMVIGLVVTLLIGAGVSLWIIRSVLRQLGGDPAYANEVVQAVAGGDLRVTVQTRQGDDTSLLAAIKA